jgi:methyltransferase (TIGR00027 family)
MKPVSKTAFYCCAIRAWDAESPRPIVGDQYARRFMTDEMWRVMEPYRAERYPNAANLVRPRVIEDSLRDDLARNPMRRIVLLGAGFDSRAFRLPGGLWVEVDEEGVFAHKEPRLPAEDAPNPLVRIPIDFAAESLADRLAPYRGETEVTVVVEGVTMYLTQTETRAMLASLGQTFPHHSLLCDLVTAKFIRRFGQGITTRLGQLGARFGELTDRPEAAFLEAGYRVVKTRSLMRAIKEYEAAPMPSLLLATVFRSASRQVQVWRFER